MQRFTDERPARCPTRRIPRVTPRRRWYAAAAGALLAAGSLAPPLTATAAAVAPATVVAVSAPYRGSPTPTSPAVVAIAPGPGGRGYYVLRSDGTVSDYGVADYGSFTAGSLPVDVTATGIALDPATGGYWIICSNGVVGAFHAPFRGEPHIPSGGWGQYPAAVAIASATNGSGYYVLRANGAVNAFAAPRHGSLAGRLHYGTTAPVVAVGIALDPATGGYWIATSTGGVFAFDAPLYGSPLALVHGHYDGVATAGIAATSAGYLVARANGEVDAFSARAIAVSDNASKVAFGATVSGVASAVATGGYYLALDLTPRQGYYNPLRALTSLVPQEIDQGVDYCGSGPIYALGDGVVTNLYDPSWPSGVFISYRLSDGPAAGHVVYIAENVTPAVSIGERVNPGTVVGVLHDAKTCLETGWARDSGRAGYAAGFAQFNGKNSTAYGLNFSALLDVLGARPGLVQPYGPAGILPAGWPTWVA